MKIKTKRQRQILVITVVVTVIAIAIFIAACYTIVKKSTDKNTNESYINLQKDKEISDEGIRIATNSELETDAALFPREDKEEPANTIEPPIEDGTNAAEEQPGTSPSKENVPETANSQTDPEPVENQVPVVQEPAVVDPHPTEDRTVNNNSNNSGAITDSELLASVSAAGTIHAAEIQTVLNCTNQYRAEVGLPPLTLDFGLVHVASARAKEMADNLLFSHTRPDGTSCFELIKLGYGSFQRAGENIALGTTGIYNAAKISEGWRNSPEHYANMVESGFSKIGIGVCEASDGNSYWCQIFVGH